MKKLTKFMVFLVVLGVLPYSVVAKPRSRIFKADQAQVYVAAVRVIALHGRVQYTDEKAGIVSFTVHRSAWTGELTCSATLQPGQNLGETEMVINVEKVYGQAFALGAGGKSIQHIFDLVEDDLNAKNKK
jgi:hypothetical protein